MPRGGWVRVPLVPTETARALELVFPTLCWSDLLATATADVSVRHLADVAVSLPFLAFCRARGPVGYRRDEDEGYGLWECE